MNDMTLKGCLAAAALCMAAIPSAGFAAEVELRLGAGFPEGELLANPITKLAELIEEKSDGEIDATVFYQSLGTQQQLAQAVMSGTVDIGSMANGNAARFTDAFLVFDLPFLFKEYNNLFKTLDQPAGQQIIGTFEEDLGVKYLFAMNNAGGRDIQTRETPVRTPADIANLKIRTTSSPIDMVTFRAWGATPTPVDFGQLYSATQQGVVDGFQFGKTILLSAKLLISTQN
ncbi:MAG: TRAP transporter substrate-binding protein [Salipiger thiooxidans]